MGRLAVIGVAAVLALGACGGDGEPSALRTADQAVEETTTTTAEPSAALSAEETTTTLAGATTTVPAPTTSTTTGGATTSTTAGATTTTAAVTTTTAQGTTTTAAPTTTTSAPSTTTTTRQLETVAALMIGRPGKITECVSDFEKGIPVGMDFEKLAADLAARGYQMGKVRFRDRNAVAIPDPPERNIQETRRHWYNCSSARGGPGPKAILTTDGTAGTRAFAELVVGQLDAIFQGSDYSAYYTGVIIE